MDSVMETGMQQVDKDTVVLEPSLQENWKD